MKRDVYGEEILIGSGSHVGSLKRYLLFWKYSLI